jgi:integrase
MASVRRRVSKSGSYSYQVVYRLDGRQSSVTLTDQKDAENFAALVNLVGPGRALDMHGLSTQPVRFLDMTVAKWVEHYIANLSGVERRTPADYRGTLRNDIAPALGDIPIDRLSRDDIAGWVEKMRTAGASGKTIANKHGLLSAALNAAVRAKHITTNPAVGVKLPRTERDEMRFLTHAEFAQLLAEVSEPWQPMIRFMVASGARLSEVTALKPGDVDQHQHTVRISRAWKRGPGGYHVGPPKTRRSIRTINIPAAVLNDLTYTNEWLFTNPGRGNRAGGGPVRAPNFRANVWWPACARANLPPPRPRIHDLRHTCASWMIAAAIPLPVIQGHLGHEAINTTVSLYGHLDRQSYKQAADAIERALPPGL